MLLGFQLSLVWAGIQLVRVVSATSKETCPMVRFKQSESENGDVFCATSPSPNAAISVNTKNDCFHKCAHSADTCAAGFNYKHVEKRCEMFATAPTTLQFQQDCEYHTVCTRLSFLGGNYSVLSCTVGLLYSIKCIVSL